MCVCVYCMNKIGTLAPFFSAVTDSLLYGESVLKNPPLLGGVGLTCVGLIITAVYGEAAEEAGTVTRGGGGTSTPSTATLLLGCLFQILNVLFDVLGAAITQNHMGDMNTFSVNFFRFGISAALAPVMSALIVGGGSVFKSAQTSELVRDLNVFHLPKLSSQQWRTMVAGVLCVTVRPHRGVAFLSRCI